MFNYTHSVMSKKILNLGCGRTRIPNSIGVDVTKIEDYVDVIHDLDILPYPFESNSIDEIHMYHVLEHLHEPSKKMDEIYRILKPKGILHIRVPHFSSMGAFTDITHIRPFGYLSFNYLNKDDYHHFYTKSAFKILHREIKYLGLYPNKGLYEKYIHKNQLFFPFRPFIHIVNFLIRVNPIFFERVWCYWVGGATEVVFTLQKDA